jgi:hypothetical protein
LRLFIAAGLTSARDCGGKLTSVKAILKALASGENLWTALVRVRPSAPRFASEQAFAGALCFVAMRPVWCGLRRRVKLPLKAGRMSEPG